MQLLPLPNCTLFTLPHKNHLSNKAQSRESDIVRKNSDASTDGLFMVSKQGVTNYPSLFIANCQKKDMEEPSRKLVGALRKDNLEHLRILV